MLKLTKTGIGLLTKQYRSVLRKCLLLNFGMFTIGLLVNNVEAVETVKCDRVSSGYATTVDGKTTDYDCFMSKDKGAGVYGTYVMDGVTRTGYWGKLVTGTSNIEVGWENALSITRWQINENTFAIAGKMEQMYNDLETPTSIYSTIKTTIRSASKASDRYLVTEKAVATALADKQSTLSTAQLNAANSGITAAKVSTYDGYATTIAGKMEQMYNDLETPTSIYSTIKTTIRSASKASDRYLVTEKAVATALADKQSTLSTAQLNAANSGITASKVTTYDGYATTIAGKADKSTTLSGYGIGDAYTKTEVNSLLSELSAPEMSNYYTKSETYSRNEIANLDSLNYYYTFRVDESNEVIDSTSFFQKDFSTLQKVYLQSKNPTHLGAFTKCDEVCPRPSERFSLSLSQEQMFKNDASVDAGTFSICSLQIENVNEKLSSVFEV